MGRREREEHGEGGKNKKIKEKEKLLTGNHENQQRKEILVKEALMIYNDEIKEVIIKTIKTKKEGQCEQEKQVSNQ